MSTATINKPFAGRTMRDVVAELTAEVRELYTADQVPWVIGYSGGKDSTAVLQLVWTALTELPPEQRTKPVYVISTDTLVENPIVAAWVNRSLETMRKAAEDQGLPIKPNRLTPDVKDTFWVSLIGKGYPSPRPKFRWCTERLKIKPSNTFIRNVVASHGEAILVLGTRKAESQARARTMEKHEKYRVRDRLSPNGNLPNSLVYSPIEAWTSDDVWMFLMQKKNPWGHSNKDLLTMYQSASDDSECPLVVDSSTPSCGDSRFGCWTCTLVEEDKSMTAMVLNDEEKAWMGPLLALRNRLDPYGGERTKPGEERRSELLAAEREKRDFRRMGGQVTLYLNHDQKHTTVPGPYKQDFREEWLRDLLKAQATVRANGPEDVRDLDLITLEELHEIRRIWVFEKHEIEDRLPGIYEDVTGEKFPGGPLNEHVVLGSEDVDILRELCEGDDLHFEMTRSLIAVERQYRTMARRSGLFDALEKAVRRSFYDSEEDAAARGRLMLEIREIRKGNVSVDQLTMTPDAVGSEDAAEESCVAAD